MSMSAQNIAADYYRSVSMNYAQAANFQKTKEALKLTREAVAPTKPTKVVMAEAVRESQKLPLESLKVAEDIRRFAAEDQRGEAVESKVFRRADAQAEKAAEAMARNVRKRKPVFQTERKQLSLLA